jgi:hypothetical protein
MNDSDDFNLEKLRIKGDTLPKVTLKRALRPRRHQSNEAFLTGPIPWNWLLQAGQLSGCALHVGIVLWRESKMKRSRTVQFCLSHLNGFGKTPDVARRGLRALEAKGLIAVKQAAGQCSQVTILEVTIPDTNSGQTSGGCTNVVAGTLLLPGT